MAAMALRELNISQNSVLKEADQGTSHLNTEQGTRGTMRMTPRQVEMGHLNGEWVIGSADKEGKRSTH